MGTRDSGNNVDNNGDDVVGGSDLIDIRQSRNCRVIQCVELNQVESWIIHGLLFYLIYLRPPKMK